MYRTLLPIFLMLLPLAPVGASTAPGDVVALDKGVDVTRSFESQRQAVLSALADGVTYREIAPEDMQIVRESLALMSSLLGGAEDVTRLPDAVKVQVFNEQERVNTLLARAHADSRLVCRREKPTGSNRSVNRCMTVAERTRERDNAQDLMRHHKKSEEIVISR